MSDLVRWADAGPTAMYVATHDGRGKHARHPEGGAGRRLTEVRSRTGVVAARESGGGLTGPAPDSGGVRERPTGHSLGAGEVPYASQELAGL